MASPVVEVIRDLFRVFDANGIRSFELVEEALDQSDLLPAFERLLAQTS